MPIKCVDAATNRTEHLPYLHAMCMGSYLRFVVAPAFGLVCADDTVLAKVHTPDLRVVFNNECNHRMLKDFLVDESTLIITPYNAADPSTTRSLRGNASAPVAAAR